jgi:hypothetical protein
VNNQQLDRIIAKARDVERLSALHARATQLTVDIQGLRATMGSAGNREHMRRVADDANALRASVFFAIRREEQDFDWERRQANDAKDEIIANLESDLSDALQAADAEAREADAAREAAEELDYTLDEVRRELRAAVATLEDEDADDADTLRNLLTRLEEIL